MSDNPFLGIDPKNLVEVTNALINVSSVSLDEDQLCGFLVEYVDSYRNDVEVVRVDNSFVVKANHDGTVEPIIFAGHLDTVPPAEFEGVSNAQARIVDEVIYGLGASDMKSGLAIMLALLSDIAIASTFIFYEAEEIEQKYSGLLKIKDHDESLLKGKWAVILEPTDGQLELGCQGTISAKAIFEGKRAHSARPWMGENAIHKMVDVLDRVTKESVNQSQLNIDSLVYTSTLQTTLISGGVAKNVIPDHCEFVLNRRYTPDVSGEEAKNYIENVLEGADHIEIVDNTPGAMPAIDHPLVSYAKENNIGIVSKVAWTDVARFYEMGIDALNCGPGDATFAHRADEHVYISKLEETYELLKNFIDSI